MTAPTASAVRERPILFNSEMVRAILAGRKVQTRRPVQWKPREAGINLNFSGYSVGMYNTANPESGYVLCMRNGAGRWADKTYPAHCPYGRPGDRLWVRETWALVPRTAYAASVGVQQTIRPDDPYHHDAAVYRAGWDRTAPGRWRPSIHMPRWASRIMLEITGIRVERVNEITPADAVAEGVGAEWDEAHEGNGPRDRYRALWDSLNAARGYPFDGGAFVWVIEFRRIGGED